MKKIFRLVIAIFGILFAVLKGEKEERENLGKFYPPGGLP